jgi:K+-transporting ATPase KdpF subunit
MVDGSCLRPPLKESKMENLLAALVSLAIAIYLLYALLRPEKF